MTTTSLLANFQRNKKRALLFKGKKLSRSFQWKRTGTPKKTSADFVFVRRKDTTTPEEENELLLVQIDEQTEEMMQVEVTNLISESGGTISLFAMARALRESQSVLLMHNTAKDADDEAFVQEFSSLSLQRRQGPTLKSALYSLEVRVGSTEKNITSWRQAKTEYLSEVLSFSRSKTKSENKAERPVVVGVQKSKPALTDVAKYMKRIIEATRKETRREVQFKSYGMFQQVAKTVLPEQEQPPDLVEDAEAEKKKPTSRLSQVIAAHTKRLEDAYQQQQIRRTPPVVQELEHQAEAEEMATSLLRPLTNEEREIVREAMYGTGPDTEVVAQVGTDSVQRVSMHRLQPGQWLNDEIIHYFMVMLANRDEEMCRADPTRKRSHFFKSFFMTKLLDIGNSNPDLDGKYNYKNVRRWSRFVPGKDIFALDKVFFPVNVGGVHWICVVANISEKTIQCYDSMLASGSLYLKSIFQYLQDEHKAKKGDPMPDLEKWKLVETKRDTPQQLNGFDCGVFTCMFADFLSKDCPLAFPQEHVTQCRERIALAIMNGKAII